MNAGIDIDRLGPTRLPTAWTRGRHQWLDLAFLHWRVPVADLRPLVPPELTIDTWDGSAWVALVPFRIRGLRPWWSPAVPGVSAFLETNVRTYVHHAGRLPGVWFFSLDAANRLAVHLARRFWFLNYQFSRMRLERTRDRVRYDCRRFGPDSPGAGGRVEVAVGPSLPQQGPGGAGTAEPGSLEHFLAERYVLYARDPRGRLWRGRVHHPPYPLRQAACGTIDETLLAAAGIDVAARPPDHVLFSEGVRVRVFSLERVAANG